MFICVTGERIFIVRHVCAIMLSAGIMNRPPPTQNRLEADSSPFLTVSLFSLFNGNVVEVRRREVGGGGRPR